MATNTGDDTMDLNAFVSLAKTKLDLPEGFDPQQAIAQEINSKVEGLKNKNYELIGKIQKYKEKLSTVPEDFDSSLWERLAKYSDKVDVLEKIDWNSFDPQNQQNQQNQPDLTARLDELKKSLTEKHQQELSKFEETTQKLTSALEQQLVDNAVIKALDKAKGNTALLLPHVKSQVRMVQDDETGEFQTIVVDGQGKMRYSLEKGGEPMSVEELVNEFKAKEEFAIAFESQNRGGGAPGSTGHYTDANNPFDKSSKAFSYTEQARLTKTNPSLAARLKAMAENK